MKWTKEKPKKSGFYWVISKPHGIFDIHHQGPYVLDVDVDEEGISVMEPGGDYERDLETYLEQEETSCDFWSDEPIFPPED